MSPVATTLAYIGAAIFLILFAWKSRDFFNEAWNDAKANQFPPRKCLMMAMAHTILIWLLIIGSFGVFGIVAIQADSLVMGFLSMGVYAIVLILLIIKLNNRMPVKARDLEEKRR